MDTHSFRKGDKVIVAAIVEFVIDGRIKIQFEGLHSNAYVSAEALEITTPIFHPGERVVHANGGSGEIVAVHEDLAWVDMDGDGGMETLFASDLSLEPVDAPQAEVPLLSELPSDWPAPRFATDNALAAADTSEVEF